jgi:hypothetical protein
MRKRSNLLRVGLSLLLATMVLSGCAVSASPAHYDGVVVVPRPYDYHPYYHHPYDGRHPGYDGWGWHGRR